MIRKLQGLRRGSSMWRRCSSFPALKQIHAFMVVNGFNTDLFALRELIFASAIAISGTIDYAHRLFDHISQPDIFIWNTMIRGSSQSSRPFKAIYLFSQMERSCVRPDHFTFPFLLKASTRLSSISLGSEIHGKILKFGFESDDFIRNSLINLHANCGDLNVASAIFRGAPMKDVVAWSSLIAGVYAKCGEMESARKLFDAVLVKDVVSWNAMIAGYVLQGSQVEAMEVFEEMQRAGERPDEVTLLSLLSACADSGALDIGQRIHCSLVESGSNYLSTVLGNALIDMYAKCGSIGKAMEVFRGMREKDISTWNSMIGGLAFHGHGEESIQLFAEMRRERVRPDEITFVGVLVGCSHGGMVEEGWRYFDLMMNEYGIEPNVKHYGCMVDILGRAGLLIEAFELVENMRIEPNAIIWRTLLGACRVHGNVELGERANKRLLDMRHDQSGDFVLLSNIYASMGEWGGAEKVRKLMDDRGVMKAAGCSVVEADNNQGVANL
ncbi:hypothetical protein MRB53_035917 [Persea americana]|uniref:Uncharacterized protein n=1 Tax=Persea americana TaxID=3435 RepID=A0ACC2K630_PERAE|nr:hypothetical protein MRB53_035917 [Persea americana]